MTVSRGRKFLFLILGNTRAVSALVCLLLLCGSSAAQAPASAAAHSGAPREQRITPAEILAEFEAPEDEPYRLGEGDEITVEIWGHPELSARHVIGPDGIISQSVAGSLRLAGLTRDEAVAEITQALNRYYKFLSVTLRVDKYTSNRILILGRVAKPGALQFDVPPTLLQVITEAGSLPIGGIGADKAALTRCAVFRGRDRVVWIDLRKLLKDANPAMNLRLRRNDIVYLPDADDQLVYVLGEVQRPGAMRLTPEMVLLDALAEAGGLTLNASADKIQLIRPSKGSSEILSLNQILSPNTKSNFSLEEGDIIYAPRRTLARFGYVLEKVNPITTYLLLGAALRPK